jgi:chorismate dehydratase
VRKAALAVAPPDLDLAQVFQQSRDHGLQHIPEIVSAWAPRLGLPEKLAADYLAENVDYSLDQENLEGLRLFFRYAEECQVLPAAPEIQFLEGHRPARW